MTSNEQDHPLPAKCIKLDVGAPQTVVSSVVLAPVKATQPRTSTINHSLPLKELNYPVKPKLPYFKNKTVHTYHSKNSWA